MVQAYVFVDDDTDQFSAHRGKDVGFDTLSHLGVLYWKVDPTNAVDKPLEGQLGEIRSERGYKNHDIIYIHPEKLPNYEAKIKTFFEEHLHEDEEIRFCIDGSGYFDVRNENDNIWIRIHVFPGDMIVLPAGIYHRFTLDQNKFIQAMRLFKDAPKWEAINRSEKSEGVPSRNEYIKWRAAHINTNGTNSTNGIQILSSVSANGESFLIAEGAAKSLANYPHLRAVNGLLYVSGLSSRRPDNSHVGATKLSDGTWDLDIKLQTAAVIENIEKILSLAGANLSHVIDITTFLVDMKHYAGYNEVYNRYFKEPVNSPTRTTVAVHQLPHPNLLIEIKAIAVDPRAQKK